MLLATTGVAAAQTGTPPSCPDGRITTIFVDNHSIYDLAAQESKGAARSFYRLANALHVKTREGFIRSELLFHVGDCYDALRLSESGRILRSYPFIARADVFAVTQPDGSKHVVVDTQDEWTTRVDLGVNFDAGLQLETLSLTEDDLAGRGIQAAAFIHQRQERKDAGVRVNFPRVLGTRTNALLSGGHTRVGTFREEALTYPFVGELGHLAARQTFSRRDELFPYAVGDGKTYSHVLLPYLDERLEVSLAGRMGRPGNLTLLGVGITREKLSFGDFPTSLEIARNSDFGSPEPAPGDLDGMVAPQTTGSSTTRLNLLVGQRNLRFVRAHGLDPLNGVQDVQLGTDVGLTVGRGIRSRTASGGAAPKDVYARARFFAGDDPGTSYVFFNASVEGRRAPASAGGRSGWHDVIGEADFYGYVRSPYTPNQTFFARVSGAGGWNTETPFQLTLGGRSSVRGFREQDFPGSRRLIATLEDRIFVPWPAPDALDFGFTLFTDVGRVWSGDAPFSRTSDWKGTAGGGLRLGFPRGSRWVARMDVAFPLLDTVHRSPVFRVTLYELLGLNTGFADPQLVRSRRVTLGPDSFTQEGR